MNELSILSQQPGIKPRLPLFCPKEALKAFKMRNLEIFIVSRKKPNGMFGFPNNFIEEALKVLSTTRNWPTVTRIVEMEA